MLAFEDHVLQNLSTELEQLEEARVHALAEKKRATNLCVTISLTIVAVSLVICLVVGNPMPILFSLALSLIVSLITYNQVCGNSVKFFEHNYKTKLVQGIAKTMQPKMEFYPYKGISEQLFRSCGHYTTGIDRYHTEDLFEGSIGATKLLFGELHAEYKTTSTDSKGRKTTSWHTIFEGVMLVADFNKHFNTWVTVRPDNETDGFFGWIGQKIQGFSNSLVKLESPTFEKHFRVNAGDATGTMYILTPDMQERLLDLRNTLGSGIIISFQKSNIYITAPKSRNWFEPDINISVKSRQQIKRIGSQIQHYFQIVEMLNLNTRIWTKE